MDLTLTGLKLAALVAAGIPVMACAAWLNVRFGVEWERVLETGPERKPEARMSGFTPRDANEPDGFLDQWAYVQARFAESPEGAVAEADDLVWFLMKTRGCLVSDVNQPVDDLSAGHRRVAEDYRSACEVVSRIGKEPVTIKELGTAMIQYGSVFDELIRAPQERSEVA
jgi:hypothetical protein